MAPLQSFIAKLSKGPSLTVPCRRERFCWRLFSKVHFRVSIFIISRHGLFIIYRYSTYVHYASPRFRISNFDLVNYNLILLRKKYKNVDYLPFAFSHSVNLNQPFIEIPFSMIKNKQVGWFNFCLSLE